MDSRENAPLAVELFVQDVDEAARFYADALGFEVMRVEHGDAGQAVFAIVALGEAVVMFMLDHFYAGQRAELDERGAGIDVRIMVPDADAVYERARAAGLDVMHEIGDRYYGLRDFIVRDPYGFRLRFATVLESPPPHP
jgi:uncharacterized glyoxalase superfamily protein PhnB